MSSCSLSAVSAGRGPCPSGRALIISIEPDETLSAVRRIDQASLDLASGRLVIGAEIGSYADVQEFDIALAAPACG